MERLVATGLPARSIARRLDLGGIEIPPARDAGAVAGGLLPGPADELGLDPGTPVVPAGPDTQAGLVGLGTGESGQVGVMAGWSAAVQYVTRKPVFDSDRGLWTGRHVLADRWVTEGNAPTEGVPTFGQVKFQPSQLSCYLDVSRQTLLQSSFDVEQFLRSDLAANLAIEIDRTVLHGSGSGAEPTGIFGTSGIGDVAGGTNGLAPIWAHAIELETDVSVANADLGSLAYITNSKVRGKLKVTEKASGTGLFVWQDPANVSPAMPGAPLNGYPAFVTNQVRSDLTKGTASTCSAIFFGNWEEGIVAVWSDLEILVDPYSGSSAGLVRLVALAFADFQVRHPESFSVMKDALT